MSPTAFWRVVYCALFIRFLVTAALTRRGACGVGLAACHAAETMRPLAAGDVRRPR